MYKKKVIQILVFFPACAQCRFHEIYFNPGIQDVLLCFEGVCVTTFDEGVLL